MRGFCKFYSHPLFVDTTSVYVDFGYWSIVETGDKH